MKSMFHAAYRRKVFETIGGFDERLARTEDNEIHYRMRKAGFKLCFDPEIISYQHIRPDLGKMLKQKYANGYWIGLTTGGAHRAFPVSFCAICLCDGNYPVGTFCTGFAIAGSITALSGRHW